jgi:general stress protein 26
MSQKTLKDLAKKMRDIDIAVLSTHSEGGQIAGRQMSNNRDVEYDGDSYYFTLAESRTAHDISRDPKVALAFQGRSGLLGQRPLFVAVEGEAELIRDKDQFKAHWTPDLDIWFKDGVDTPGLVLIKVHATRLHYWDGMDEGEIALSSAQKATAA